MRNGHFEIGIDKLVLEGFAVEDGNKSWEWSSGS